MVRIEDRGGPSPASLNSRKIKHILDTNNDIDFLTSLELDYGMVYYPNLLMSLSDGNHLNHIFPALTQLNSDKQGLQLK